jgi:hypothetical protein
VVVTPPDFDFTGPATSDIEQTPDFGGPGSLQWTYSSAVSNTDDPSLQLPGSFTGSGNVVVHVEPEDGDKNGTPVTVHVTAQGSAWWDEDPDFQGYATNSVSLDVSHDGDSTALHLKGAHDDLNWNSWYTSYDKGTVSWTVPTQIDSTFSITYGSQGSTDGSWIGGSGDIHGEVGTQLDLSMTVDQPPTSDVVAKNITWDVSAGKLNYQYEVMKPLTNRQDRVELDFDWIDKDGNRLGAATSKLYDPVTLTKGVHSDSINLASMGQPLQDAVGLKMTVDPAHAVDTVSSVRTVDLFKITPKVSANKDTPGDNLFGTYLQGVKLNVGFTAKLPAADAALQTLPLTTQFQMKSASQSVGSPVDGTKLNPTSWLSTQNVGLATDGMGMTAQILWGKAAIGEVNVPFKLSIGTVEAAVKAQIPVAGSSSAKFTALSAVRYLTGVNPDVVVKPDFRAVLTGNGIWYASQLLTAELNGFPHTVTPVAGSPGTFDFHAGNVSLLPAGNLEIKFGFAGGTGKVIEAGQVAQTILMTQVPTWLTGGAESYDAQNGKYHLGFGWKKSLFDKTTAPHSVGGVTMPEGWTDTLDKLATNATLTSDLQANVPVLLSDEPKFKVSKAKLEATLLGRAITPKTISTDLFQIDGSLDATTLKLNGLGISLKNPYMLLDATQTPLFHGSVTIPVSNSLLYTASVTLSVTVTATVKVKQFGLFAQSDENGNLTWNPNTSVVVIEAKPKVTVEGHVDLSAVGGLVKLSGSAGGELNVNLTFSAGLSGPLTDPNIVNISLDATLSGSWYYNYSFHFIGDDHVTKGKSPPDGVFGPIELFQL